MTTAGGYAKCDWDVFDTERGIRSGVTEDDDSLGIQHSRLLEPELINAASDSVGCAVGHIGRRVGKRAET